MKYLLLFSFGLVCFGCSPKMSPDEKWAQQRWVVVEMKGVPVQQSGGRRDAFLTFSPAEKSFSGNGGCNQINGNYSIEKKEIHFTNVASTKMSCADIAFENTFLTTLSSINNFETSGEDIRLRNKKETLIVLRPRPTN
jgi:heat shock protein HslJ